MIEARGWASEQVAEVLSLSEAEVSRLFAGMLKGFSVADLLRLLDLVERGA